MIGFGPLAGPIGSHSETLNMIRNTLRTIPALCLLFYAAVATGADGFIDLFNGKDLSGWINPPGSGWVVEEGVIALTREIDGKEHNHEYLWTEQ